MFHRNTKSATIRFCLTAFMILWTFDNGLPLLAEENSKPIATQTPIGLDDFRAIQPVLTAAEHPWGRFEPSSWSRLQMITIIRGDAKSVRNVAETKKVLESVDRDGVTLRESKTIEYAGRRVESAAMIRRSDFFQESILDHQTITSGKPEKLIVDHLIVPCEKRVYERETPSGKYKTTLWYSTQVYPYIFRVERIHRSADSATVLSQATTEVLQSSAFRLRKSRIGTCLLQTIRKAGNITMVTETHCSRHVPGGIVKETTRELDQTGKEIRLIETRLLNYYCAAPKNETDFESSVLSKESPTLLYENSKLRWRRSLPGPLSEKRQKDRSD